MNVIGREREEKEMLGEAKGNVYLSMGRVGSLCMGVEFSTSGVPICEMDTLFSI